ncbi:glycosyltransferase [Kocuria sp. NPDC057446]|uniref:glycosyltransferase n=1 Tax=Kocuria sp. NPDC057446 TaxID=3346137 RepID=UPI0036951E48
MKQPTVAIAHDYLTQRGGAERVVLAMHRAFPDATIYTTLYNPESTYPEFQDANIVTSPLNKLGVFRRNHRLALPFLAFASQALRVREDVAVISSSGWAHGFTFDGNKMVYCHSPARWLYFSQQYLGSALWRRPAGWSLWLMRPILRLWDQRAAANSVVYVANSTHVKKRVKEVYGREVDVLHPPYGVDTNGPREPIPGLEDFVGVGGHFLLVSRLLPYKNVNQAIEAFRGLNQRLVIVGAGPLRDELVESAPINVKIVSHLTDAQMRWIYSTCEAVVAPSFEDFGLTPVEAAAYGKPTIALRAGGYLDTVVEGATGLFIDAPSPDSIRESLAAFPKYEWDGPKIQEHAEQFSAQVFIERLQEIVRDMGEE